MQPSKHILNILESNEELRLVVSSSKGWFNSLPDIAVTNQRIFARLSNGTMLSIPQSKIESIEEVPDKGMLGRAKKSGVVRIIGNQQQIDVWSKDAAATKTEIERALAG